jgi:hypothetical protein
MVKSQIVCLNGTDVITNIKIMSTQTQPPTFNASFSALMKGSDCLDVHFLPQRLTGTDIPPVRDIVTSSVKVGYAINIREEEGDVIADLYLIDKLDVLIPNYPVVDDSNLVPPYYKLWTMGR